MLCLHLNYFFMTNLLPLTRNYVPNMILVKSNVKNLDFEVKKAKFKIEYIANSSLWEILCLHAFSGSLLKFYDYPQNFAIRKNTRHAQALL
jgi:hypothetical protein